MCVTVPCDQLAHHTGFPQPYDVRPFGEVTGLKDLNEPNQKQLCNTLLESQMETKIRYILEMIYKPHRLFWGKPILGEFKES